MAVYITYENETKVSVLHLFRLNNSFLVDQYLKNQQNKSSYLA